MNINTRIMHRPLVAEEKHINFDEDEDKNKCLNFIQQSITNSIEVGNIIEHFSPR